MKKIILPTDFSEGAKNAIKYALELYKGRGFHFTILNTYDMPAANTSMIVSLDNLLREESLKGLADELKIFKPLEKEYNFTIDTHCEKGELTANIERLIKKEKYNLVIMGTTGASGIKEILIGSNATSVIQSSFVPVIAVPVSATYKGIKHIMIAADLKKNKDKDLFHLIKEMAVYRGSKLTLLNVKKSSSKISSDERMKEKDNLMNYFAECNPIFDQIENENTSEGLNAYIATHSDLDLVVMVPRKNNFFDRIFRKSITNKVAFEAKIPLFAIHDRD